MHTYTPHTYTYTLHPYTSCPCVWGVMCTCMYTLHPTHTSHMYTFTPIHLTPIHLMSMCVGCNVYVYVHIHPTHTSHMYTYTLTCNVDQRNCSHSPCTQDRYWPRPSRTQSTATAGGRGCCQCTHQSAFHTGTLPGLLGQQPLIPYHSSLVWISGEPRNNPITDGAHIHPPQSPPPPPPHKN